MRWFIVIFLALVLLSSALPWLERIGLGRLPGDLNFSIFGWKIRLPFASTILLTSVCLLLGRLI
jgi:hypothetical protein